MTPVDVQTAVQDLLRREYGLDGSISRLGGENQNYLVRLGDGRRFVLKLHDDAAPESSGGQASLEHAVVEHLISSGIELELPRTVLTFGGAIESHVEGPAAGRLSGRLIAFVSGTPWCEAGTAGPERLLRLGHTLATVDLALAAFTHSAAQRTHRWDLSAVTPHRSKVALVDAPARRRALDEAFLRWAALAAPRLPDLPRSVIYGDANDENVLVDGDDIVGLLDFGDTLEAPVVCELAVAIVYAALDAQDPLGVGAEIVAGYHAVRPLSAAEREVLFPLVLGRLAASVSIAAERRRADPTRTSWFVTEDRAWRLLERLVTLDPGEASRALTSRIRVPATVDTQPSSDELLRARRRYIGPSLSLSYRTPLTMVRGQGQYLFDDRGRPYLDLVNNVCHVGHCHPHVVGAGERQMRVLNTNTRYLHDEIVNYAARLTATLPPPLEVCFFVNSGSEANELALRLARAHTGRRDVAVVDGAYHGNTSALVAMSPYKFKGPGGSGVTEPWVHVVPMPDPYRGRHRGDTRATGEAYGEEAGRVIARAGKNLAAFFAESLLSCGGQIVVPPGYLETTFAQVRAAGGLAVVDEVQVGFGRVGSHFWGFELQGVVPDIVVMGKPIGNGHPMGAVVTTREIAKSFDNGMEFFSTFGGNPVSCAIGQAVLEVIERERLQARASTLGARLLSGLRGVAARHPIIGDVRGAGLFLGFEMVRDRQTLEPAAAEASDLVNRLVTRGLLLSTDGPLHNVIKIKPPLVLTEDDVDMAVRAIDEELSA